MKNESILSIKTKKKRENNEVSNHSSDRTKQTMTLLLPHL